MDRECFVFDREYQSMRTRKGNMIMFCLRSAITDHDKKSKNIKKEFIAKCKDYTSLNQKKGFSERNRQIEIAKKKGIKHLGS